MPSKVRPSWEKSIGRSAAHVFLDPGTLLGHFSYNGMLLLPDQKRTLFFDDVGEPGVTLARLKAEVVVCSPWSTRRHH